MNVESRLQRLFEKPLKNDILYFLESENHSELDRLYQYANHIKEKYLGDSIWVRGIIEFSNFCKNRCRYCGINCNIRKLQRYRLLPEEIVDVAYDSFLKGFRTIILQSGEDSFYTNDDYISIIKKIKKFGDIAVTLAIGEREVADYFAFKEAGADRYLLKHETSDAKLYQRLNPGMSLEKRLNLIKSLKKMGYETGSGIMIGLPGQTIESIAEDILLFKELDLDMMGSGPFIPHPDTPLSNESNGSVDLTYRVMALTRIITKDKHIPATTALTTLAGSNAIETALSQGANVVMLNVTPEKYRKLYDLYPKRGRQSQPIHGQPDVVL